MVNPHRLLENVTFTSDFSTDSLVYNQQLGFLQVDPRTIAFNGLRVVGFAIPFAREGGFDMRDEVRPLTRFDELPPEHRTTAKQGKGVGPRLHNVLQAIAGYPDKPPVVGVYSYDIDPDHLLDARTTQGGTVARLGRHAGRMVRAKLGGLESVVQDIHDSYAAALDGRRIDAVELEMPPLPLLRQKEHGVQTPDDITPSFMIIRDPDSVLLKIGQADTPGL